MLQSARICQLDVAAEGKEVLAVGDSGNRHSAVLSIPVLLNFFSMTETVKLTYLPGSQLFVCKYLLDTTCQVSPSHPGCDQCLPGSACVSFLCLQALDSAAKLRTITCLTLVALPAVTNEGIKLLCIRTQLKSLHIICCTRLSSEAFVFLDRLTNLQSLTIQKCPKVKCVMSFLITGLSH